MQKLVQKFLALNPTPDTRYSTFSVASYARLDSYTTEEEYQSSAELIVLKSDGKVYLSYPRIVNNTYNGLREPDVIVG